MASTKEKKESIWNRPIGGGKKDAGSGAAAKTKGGAKQSAISRPIGGGRSKAGGRAGRGKMPTKQSINLVINEKQSMNPVRAIVLSAVIIVAAGAFSKFMVIDRITEMSEATGRVTQLRSSLTATEEAIASFGELQETYAHYTYSGMTEEELGLVDRAAVLDMAEAAFASGGAANNWQLSGNTLSAEVTGKTLEELNELAQFLESFDIVDRCAITMANKTTDNDNITDVRASFIIYLQQPEEEGGA